MATTPNPDNPTASFDFTIDAEDINLTVEFHFSDNAEKYFEIQNLVDLLSSAMLAKFVGQ